MNPIQQHQAAVLANITGSFIEQSPNVEVFTEANLMKYSQDLQKSLDIGRISHDVFEKGMKDLTKLQKKVITNSQGHQQTVYVRVHQDNTEHHFTHGDKVKFEHKGKSVVGEIKGLKHHDKFDPFGTALVHDAEGNKYSKSLRAIEHHSTPSVTKDTPLADEFDQTNSKGQRIKPHTKTETPAAEPAKPVKGDKPLSTKKVAEDDEVKVTAEETWTDKDGKEISAGDQVYHTTEGDTYHATVVGPATSDPKKIILKKNSNGEKVIVRGSKALKLMKKFKKGMEDMTEIEKAFDKLGVL